MEPDSFVTTIRRKAGLQDKKALGLATAPVSMCNVDGVASQYSAVSKQANVQTPIEYFRLRCSSASLPPSRI